MAASLSFRPDRGDARAAVARAVERSRSDQVRPSVTWVLGFEQGTAVEVLGCVKELLAVAAGGQNADLAQVCRGVLDALIAAQPGTVTGPDGATGVWPGVLAPPGWAARSVAEDGAIVHEVVSPLRPEVVRADGHGQEMVPTEVSMSVVDVCIDDRWRRTGPTVQVEGGSYCLQGARQLRQVLDGFLARIDEEEPPTGT